MKKQNKGITLVALVITIIVLIILAGVSINAVMNGGLIENAKNARKESEVSSEKEELKVAVLEWQASKSDEVNKSLFEYLKSKYEKEDIVQVNANTIEGVMVTFIKSGNKYVVTEDGNVTLLSIKESKKTVHGNYIYANDVYPINHNLKVTLSSDTITDFSSVSIKQLGQNLLNIEGMTNQNNFVKNDDGTFTISKNGSNRFSKFVKTFIPPNSDISVSATLIDDSLASQTDFYIGFKRSDGTILHTNLKKENGKIQGQKISDDYITEIYMYLNVACEDGTYVKFKDFQVTINNEDNLNYVPYNEKVVTANTNGEVLGLTSLSPMMLIYTESTDVTINCEYISEVEDVMYNLEGKKIVNFGDSIFGMVGAPIDISTYLASFTNATVYNVGFDGCRMAKHNQYYNAFSMYSLADAVTNNNFEVQDDAITNGNLSSRIAESLEILKGIDFDDVDIVTISYGTNDFGAGVGIENENDDYDTNTVAGALRYSIEKISTAYPDIQIVICTPTYRFWMDENYDFLYDSDTYSTSKGKLTDYVEMEKSIASEYGVFVIDNYTGCGINKENRFDYFKPFDGTHFNIAGRKLIAKYMAKELYEEFGNN